MTTYKRTVTYTQVMAIIIGLAFLGIGFFSVLNPSMSFFSEGTSIIMTIIGMFVLLFGIMTPMGQLFNVDGKMVLVFSCIMVIAFMILIYILSMSVGVEVV
jgi:hypothetical protein